MCRAVRGTIQYVYTYVKTVLLVSFEGLTSILMGVFSPVPVVFGLLNYRKSTLLIELGIRGSGLPFYRFASTFFWGRIWDVLSCLATYERLFRACRI